MAANKQRLEELLYRRVLGRCGYSSVAASIALRCAVAASSVASRTALASSIGWLIASFKLVGAALAVFIGGGMSWSGTFGLEHPTDAASVQKTAIAMNENLMASPGTMRPHLGLGVSYAFPKP
jgi:hypothetical protein